uniref:Uncharacterized protein n=1 Tax=Meloidogyne enterolobii TaxID=390850 RepID=A0A6V7VG89_MELEN|nr:unnamed protein product [Meloidogyne enterolobii]
MINGFHNQISGMFTYAAQTSIAKIVELDPSSEYAKGQQGTTSSSNGNDYFKNLRLVYFGAVTPLLEAGEKIEELFNH